MNRILPIAAAVTIAASGAAYGQVKVAVKDNAQVTKIDVKATDVGKVKVMDNPGNTKVQVKPKL
jgi:hypothetical protein